VSAAGSAAATLPRNSLLNPLLSSGEVTRGSSAFHVVPITAQVSCPTAEFIAGAGMRKGSSVMCCFLAFCIFSFFSHPFTLLSGIESLKESAIPVLVCSLDGVRIRSVACGRQHTVAVAEDGSIFSWGKNSNGQCGLGHANSVYSPQPVADLLRDDVRIQCAAAGSAHTICASESGVLYSFGRGDEGQLGLGDNCGKFLKRFELIFQQPVHNRHAYRRTLHSLSHRCV
jgi:hypothetical protein